MILPSPVAAAPSVTPAAAAAAPPPPPVAPCAAAVAHHCTAAVACPAVLFLVCHTANKQRRVIINNFRGEGLGSNHEEESGGEGLPEQ